MALDRLPEFSIISKCIKWRWFYHSYASKYVSLPREAIEWLLYNTTYWTASVPNFCTKNSSSWPQFGLSDLLKLSDGKHRIHWRICLISRYNLLSRGRKENDENKNGITRKIKSRKLSFSIVNIPILCLRSAYIKSWKCFWNLWVKYNDHLPINSKVHM